MNRQNFESGYPEQHAHDSRRRESDRNAGDNHERGEYRAGRYGRFDSESGLHEEGRHRQDWYRNDEYRGYGEDARAGSAFGSSASRPGDRHDVGDGARGKYGQPYGGGYGAGPGYGQYREPNQSGIGGSSYSSSSSRGPRGYEGSEQVNDSGYSQRYGGQRGGPRGFDRPEDPRSGYSGQGQYGYNRGSHHDLAGQYGYSQGQPGYNQRGSDMGGCGPGSYEQPGSYDRAGSGQFGFGPVYGQGGNRQGAAYEPPRSRSGRTPKGYTRSDERIREDVNDRLMQAYGLDPGEIEVKVESGEVKLTGSVESREEKFLAEQLAESVSGVKDIANQLRVQRSPAGPRFSASIEQKRDGSNASSGESPSTRDTSSSNHTTSSSRNTR